METKGAWKGTLASSMGAIECTLIDSNFNGIYGDHWTYDDVRRRTIPGDRAFADTNGFGSVLSESLGKHAMPLSPAVRVGEKFYVITAAESGETITIEPYRRPTGTLLLTGDINGAKCAAQFAVVAGEAGQYFGEMDGEAVTLPVGKYTLDCASLAVESSEEEKSLFSGSMDREFRILPCQRTVVRVSGKPSIVLMPKERDLVLKPGKETTFNWDISVGESLTNAVISGCDSCPIPVVSFDDKHTVMAIPAKGG